MSEKTDIGKLSDALTVVIGTYATQHKMLSNTLEKLEGTYDQTKIRESDIFVEETTEKLIEIKNILYCLRCGNIEYLIKKYDTKKINT